MATEQKKSFDEVWAEVAEPLLSEYESLQEAFVQVGLHGISKAGGVAEKWHAPLLALIEKNVELPKRSVEGVLEAHSLENNGVELIKKAAHDAEAAVAGENVTMVYLGAGKFKINATAHDYKQAARLLEKSGNAFVAALKKFKGTATFTVQEKN